MRHTLLLATMFLIYTAAAQLFAGIDVEAEFEKQEAPDAAPAEPDLSPELIELRKKLRRCLAYYYQQRESADGRSPWGVMHSAIAFGVDTEIVANGQNVNALGWLCWNLPCRGQRLFYTSGGDIRTRNGGGVQGHEGQFLAMLAQSRVRKDFQIKVNGYEFTVQDLIEYEQLTCAPGTELTFKLIGLSHYLDSDATWQDEKGRDWSIERMIKEELAMPVTTDAACGGTHRMMGFSYAVRTREKRDEPMTGQWKRAKRYVDDYHEHTFKLQNSDGSFSTEWFRERADERDIDRRLQTTGHILEWLAYSLPDDQLKDARTVKAVDYLTGLLQDYRSNNWSIGPKGHALHALVLYDQRVFGAKPGRGGPELPEGVVPLELAEVSEESADEGDDDNYRPRRRFISRRRR